MPQVYVVPAPTTTGCPSGAEKLDTLESKLDAVDTKVGSLDTTMDGVLTILRRR